MGKGLGQGSPLLVQRCFHMLGNTDFTLEFLLHGIMLGHFKHCVGLFKVPHV